MANHPDSSLRPILVLWRQLDSHHVLFFSKLSERRQLKFFYCARERNNSFTDNACPFQCLYISNPILLVIKSLIYLIGLRAKKPVLLVHGFHRPQYLLIAILSRYLFDCKVILFSDNFYDGTQKKKFAISVLKHILPLVFNCAFAAGKRTALYLRMLGFAENNVSVGTFLPHPALIAKRNSLSKFSASDRNRNTLFIYAGRLCHDKGFDILVNAWSNLVRQGIVDRTQLQVCGDGPLRTLINHDCLSYLGYLSPEKLGDALSVSSCLIMPSRYEPFGCGTFEASMFGLFLIVGHAVGSISETVVDRKNGIVLQSLDAATLAHAIISYLKLTEEERNKAADLSLNKYQNYQQSIFRAMASI